MSEVKIVQKIKTHIYDQVLPPPRENHAIYEKNIGRGAGGGEMVQPNRPQMTM
jgi:hypothetical protein